MIELQVDTSSHSYSVCIGEDLRLQLNDHISPNYSSVLIITDNQIADLYLQDVLQGLEGRPVHYTIIPSGEASKSIDYFYKLQTFAMEKGVDRQSLIIALGGGVIGDLAGFVAATYMRGIDYIQVPTTILAHDSSVGGKVAINHELGKNMIGSFYPPKAVIYDVNTLQTLPKHEVRSGFAELVKEAFIADAIFLDQLLLCDIEKVTNEQLMEYLYLGIKIKANIVEADEKEANIRKFLNFGHTLAHALETQLGYGKITHGEAVAIGMLFALRLSEDKFTTSLPYQTFYQWLLRNHYPISLYNIDFAQIIESMKLDKKATYQEIQMILLKKIAHPVLVPVSDKELKVALESFKKELNTT